MHIIQHSNLVSFSASFTFDEFPKVVRAIKVMHDAYLEEQAKIAERIETAECEKSQDSNV